MKNLLAGTAAIGATGSMKAIAQLQKKHQSPMNALHGHINHSVCYWCYNFLSLEELCHVIRDIGFDAIDLVGPKDWPVLKKNGVYSSMCNGAEINLVDGFAEKNFHATLIKSYTEIIPLVAKAGYKNLICFSGNRRGMDDETGLKNSTEGLKQIMSLAEKHKVIIQMELLNSKINHKDYMCDKTPWGVELVKRVGSENFKLLYDIYHMQIDEGDVIRTIRDNHQYIGHYHTAGVPGRHEIDDTQELFYPAIMKAIHETGFNDFVAQEFIPTGATKEAKIEALRSAVFTCDI